MRLHNNSTRKITWQTHLLWGSISYLEKRSMVKPPPVGMTGRCWPAKWCLLSRTVFWTVFWMRSLGPKNGGNSEFLWDLYELWSIPMVNNHYIIGASHPMVHRDLFHNHYKDPYYGWDDHGDSTRKCGDFCAASQGRLFCMVQWPLELFRLSCLRPKKKSAMIFQWISVQFIYV